MSGESLLSYPRQLVSRCNSAIILFTIITMPFLAGCSGTEKTAADDRIPWSVSVPELSARLIVRGTYLEWGRYPTCIMEVVNTSTKTILLRKDFSSNGPAVYNQKGELMPQRRHLEIKAGETPLYHRLKPGEKISVRARPNHKIDSLGRYTLRFTIHPNWWGFEDPDRPGNITKKGKTSEIPVVSNEVTVTVY